MGIVVGMALGSLGISVLWVVAVCNDCKSLSMKSSGYLWFGGGKHDDRWWLFSCWFAETPVTMLELTFLLVVSFPILSTGSVSSSKRRAELHCSEAGLERLSTFDVKFSINLKISLCPNSVSLKRLDKRFSILLEMSSKSCSEMLTFSSFEVLQFSISS